MLTIAEILSVLVTSFTMATAPLPAATYAPTGAPTKAIPGAAAFCNTNPAECRVAPADPEFIHLDRETWVILNAINQRVNAEITPVQDSDHWGVPDIWSYPVDGKGDCEDYQLEKRRLLVAAGFPRRALRMTVVIDAAGSGHAVLMARTDRGDLILDNVVNEIRPWDATPYSFAKREGGVEGVWLNMVIEQDSPTTSKSKSRR